MTALDLTEGQRAALRNLASKKASIDVGWISIADARALADLGLADRVSSGWRITPAGEAMMAEIGKAPEEDAGAVTPHALGRRAWRDPPGLRAVDEGSEDQSSSPDRDPRDP